MRKSRIKTPDFLVRHKKLWSILGTVAISSYLLYSFIFSDLGVIKYLFMKQEYRRIKDEVSRLDSENKKLKSEVTSLKTDPDYIEALARERLGLAKDGETIYRFQGKENDSKGK